MFRLHPDSGKILKKSWSLRLMALSGALQSIAYVWPTADWLPAWFGFVPLGLLAGAFGARFIAQRGLSLPEEAIE